MTSIAANPAKGATIVHAIQPLPRQLADGFRRWRATSYNRRAQDFERLATEGQRPHTMLIACCDSRMLVTDIFGTAEGEMFVHRNIANLVPPYIDGGPYQATPAAIEFAVVALGVAHIVVMGHSGCGGVRAYHDLRCGTARHIAPDSFVARWMEILRPGLERCSDEPNPERRLRRLEAEGVRLSLENLLTYPFVTSAVERGQLSLHGTLKDIAAGTLHSFDAETESFTAV